MGQKENIHDRGFGEKGKNTSLSYLCIFKKENVNDPKEFGLNVEALCRKSGDHLCNFDNTGLVTDSIAACC